MSSLKEKVYDFVKNIPRGKVATYGQIALFLGNRNYARVVGNIFFMAILIRSIFPVIGWLMLKGNLHDHMRLGALRLKDVCWNPKALCSKMSRLSI